MVLTAVLADNSMNFNENPNGNAILDKFRNQRKDGRFSDIVLHVSSSTHEEKLFPAHRSVLAACSKYFESVLKTHRVTKEQINIECHDVDVFETFLDYMYSGEVTIDWNNVQELTQLADHFLMTNLTQYCIQFLEHYLSVDNCISVRDIAEKYNLSSLCGVVNQFIAENLSEIIEQPFMIEMSARKLESVLSDVSLGFLTLPPSLLLQFIVIWVKNDHRRANDFDKLLEMIEWDKLKLEFIYDHIDAEPLYRENKLFLYRTLNSLLSYKIDISKYDDVYQELVKHFEENQSEEETILAQHMDDDEMNSPIIVEPIQPSNVKKSKSRAVAMRNKKNAAQNAAQTQKASTEPRRRSSRLIKEDVEEAPIAEEEEEESGAKRKRRQKYSKNEWETYSPGTNKRKQANARDNRKEKSSESGKNEESKWNESEDGELEEENKEDETIDGMDQSMEEEDEDSTSSSKKKKQNYKINASLQHWKEGVKCPHCIYVGHSATRLEQHLAKVHEEDTTYICKMCSYICKWNREYYKHMKSHFEGPPYKCEDCEYTCDRIQFILSHRMRHTDERPFHCELCEFRSRTKGNLIVHMRIHTGEKPYKCQHCTRSFAMKNTLDQHLATHRDDRPFLCDSCGFTTKYQSHLLSHKRIHTGNVFHCDQENCTYSSPRRSQLAAHTRSHLSIRTHICSTCGRAFIEKSHLIRHERIHLDEKPFKCEQCDYGSTRRDKLKEHVLKHHSAEGAAKTPYKPRKPRRQTQNTSYIIEQSDDNSQLAIVSTSSPQEIQISHSQLTDQELCTATASLIYEYTDGGVTVSPVVIPVSYSDGNHTIVERIVETHSADSDSPSSARVVIQSIPSAYANNNQIESEQTNERNGTENNTSGNDLGGLNAFIQALF